MLFSNVETIIQKKDENFLFLDEDDGQFFLNKKIIKIDQIDAEFESFSYVFKKKLTKREELLLRVVLALP